MLLLIDNFDSFTHNLARYFTELGIHVEVVRNNAVSLDDIARLAPSHLVGGRVARYAVCGGQAIDGGCRFTGQA